MRCFKLLVGLFAVALTTACGDSAPTPPPAPFIPDHFPHDTLDRDDVAALAPATAFWQAQHGT
jgi:hypothetical protein